MSTADELMAVIRMYAKNPTRRNEFKVRATLTDFLPFADQEPNAADLQSNEQYRMQMAAISTAALGYWKEGDGIQPEYDTLALRDVARLYAKYAKAADRLEAERNYANYCERQEIPSQAGDQPFASGSLPPLPVCVNWKRDECGNTIALYDRHQMYEYARQSVHLIDEELLGFARWLLEAYHSDEGMPEAKEIAKEARAALALKGEKE